MKTLIKRVIGKLFVLLAMASLLSACVVVPAHPYRPAYRPVYVEPYHSHWHDCRC